MTPPTLLDQADALTQATARIARDIKHLALEMRRLAEALEAHRDALKGMVETGEGTAP